MPIAALSVAAVAGGCGDAEAERARQPERETIRRVLADDEAFARVRDQEAGPKTDINAVSAAVREYVDSPRPT